MFENLPNIKAITEATIPVKSKRLIETNNVKIITVTSIIVANVMGFVSLTVTRVALWNEIRTVKAGIIEIIIVGIWEKELRSLVNPETLLYQKFESGVKAIKIKIKDSEIPKVFAKFLSCVKCSPFSPIKAIITSW